MGKVEKGKNIIMPRDVYSADAHKSPKSKPIIETQGNREVCIEGLSGILEYDERIIRINSSGMIISFSGRGLTISYLTDSTLSIKGFIQKIEFLC